jgi:DNA polymerase-3 subunit beta
MKTYELPATTLKAALYCASKNDVRYYLNGIFIEPSKGRVLATDGHILFCGEAPNGKVADIIVPREVIETALKALGKKGLSSLIAVCEGDGCYKLVTLSGEFPFTPIDGKFPEYERVIPQAPKTHEVAQFDPDLLMRARDALRTYSGQNLRGFHLTHNGESAAVYSGDGINALVVVMPFRAGEPSNNAWYWGKPKKLAAVA